MDNLTTLYTTVFNSIFKKYEQNNNIVSYELWNETVQIFKHVCTLQLENFDYYTYARILLELIVIDFKTNDEINQRDQYDEDVLWLMNEEYVKISYPNKLLFTR